MATPEEMRLAAQAARTFYEGAPAQVEQGRLQYGEASEKLVALLGLLEQATTLRNEFHERLETDRAVTAEMTRTQRAAQGRINEVGMDDKNPNAKQLIDGAKATGQGVLALYGVITGQQSDLAQTSGPALLGYYNRLRNQRGQIGRSAAHLDGAKANFSEAADETRKYEGLISLAEVAARAATKIREAGGRTAGIVEGAEANRSRATLLHEMLGELGDHTATLRSLLSKAVVEQIGAAILHINDAGVELTAVGVTSDGGGKAIFKSARDALQVAEEDMSGVKFQVHGAQAANNRLGDVAGALRGSFTQIALDQTMLSAEAQRAAMRCDEAADAGEAYAAQILGPGGNG